jgi:hypothetical protein
VAGLVFKTSRTAARLLLSVDTGFFRDDPRFHDLLRRMNLAP